MRHLCLLQRLLLSLTIVPMIGVLASSARSQSTPPPGGPPPLPKDKVFPAPSTLPEVQQQQVLPYWTAEAGWASDLQLRNNSLVSLTVNPALRLADGTEVALSSVTLLPQEVTSIDLDKAIVAVNASNVIGAYGSAVLRFMSPTQASLYAAIMVRDPGHPIMVHIDAGGEDPTFQQGGREGIWWLPKATTNGYLIETNLSGNAIPVTLSLYNPAGRESRQNIVLAPHQTLRLSIRDLVTHAGFTSSYGGIKIAAAAHAGSLDSVHFLFDETAGFSALLKMFDYLPAATIAQRDYAHTGSWTLRAPMLALSSPDPALAFPSGTQLHPLLFVRNTTAKSIHASLRFTWRSAQTEGKATSPSLQLAPFQTQQVDVAALQQAGTIPPDANWSLVTLVTDSLPDEVVAVAASYDDSLRHGAQTPFNDQLTFRWEGGMWEYDAMHDSIVAAGNGGAQPVQARFTIFYNRGTQRYDLEQSIQPDDEMWVDIGQLIRNQVPDKNGNVLPSTLTSGSYEITDLSHHGAGTIFEGKVIYDKMNGDAAYGCAACCGHGEQATLWYDPLGILDGSDAVQGVQAPDMCQAGVLDDVSDSFYGNWSVQNTSIATVDYYGTHTAVTVGSTGSNTSGSYNDNDARRDCPYYQARPSGSDNVNPTVTFSSVPTGIPQGGTGTVVATVTPSGGSTTITISLTTSAGTGSATFAGGGSTTTITSSTPLTINGVSASSTANNITLDARAPNGEGGSLVSVATNHPSFSVVNVTLSLQSSGSVAIPNPLFPVPHLGVQVLNGYQPGYTSCLAAYQITGQITPSNYSGGVYLRRTVNGIDVYQDPGTLVTYSGGGFDDTSNPQLEASSGGNTYDLDGPSQGMSQGFPVGNSVRYRVNFDEYAVLGTNASTTKVSQDLIFFNRMSCVKTSSTSIVLDNTYPADNQIGLGTTPLSDNLH